ncbi:MAG: pantoate--beta-alanine ligase [Candidatus Omnitrophica bacterium]|nr:pantoate--beta-alanine ligase [Candidatus Omnitrophota bacterium]
MKVIKTVKQLQGYLKKYKKRGKTIGLVPTMGALHEGHVSLVKQARKDVDCVVVSIFVNPTQFGPREDFKRYPRTFRKDAQWCKKEKVDVIFHPHVLEMYPESFKTTVEVADITNVLCGQFRPGHFRGVATVVTKLFNIVRPDIAYFGQKDAQQVAVIKRLVLDLNMPLAIRVMPTVRERDGLAMSSRNRYLSLKQRQDAVVLYQALTLAKRMVRHGIDNAQTIIRAMKRLIQEKPSAKIDYCAIVNAETFTPLSKVGKRCLVVLAVWIGKTRLIDNAVLERL